MQFQPYSGNDAFTAHNYHQAVKLSNDRYEEAAVSFIGGKCERGVFYFFLTTIDIGKVGKEGIWYRERIGYRMTSMAQSSYVGAATNMS